VVLEAEGRPGGAPSMKKKKKKKKKKKRKEKKASICFRQLLATLIP
jgi:hypothetical protein